MASSIILLLLLQLTFLNWIVERQATASVAAAVSTSSLLSGMNEGESDWQRQATASMAAAVRTSSVVSGMNEGESDWQIQDFGDGCNVTIRNDLAKSMFPEDFIWGVGTSAGQVEGAAEIDGRTRSDWDVFSQVPGKIADGSNASVACDSYHKYEDDVDLVNAMGVQSYRFSLSWSRLLPRGGTEVNPKGVAYYNKLIDSLLEKGKQPLVTLHHLALPIEIDTQGGWLNPSIVQKFTDYAELCFKLFGDRVKMWATLNQPYHIAVYGFSSGKWPPARCSDRTKCTAGDSTTEAYQALHNMLLAHAKIVELYRTKYQGRNGGKIGINLEGPFFYPITNTTAHLAATERAFAWRFGWAWEPIYSGDYPAVMREYLGSRLPTFTAEEQALLKGSADYFGLNFYTASYVEEKTAPTFVGGKDESAENDGHFQATFVNSQGEMIGAPSALFFRPQVPAAMYDILLWLTDKYPNIPIIIAENGLPGEVLSGVERNVQLCDAGRVTFYQNYVSSVAKAIRDGANVKGYYVWSLLDNWEWTLGYTIPHGLVYVDFNDPERQRYVRASYRWWQAFLKGEGVHDNGSGIV